MNEGLSEGTQAGIGTRLDVRRRNGDSPQKRREWWCAKRRFFLTLVACAKKKRKNDEREGEKKNSGKTAETGEETFANSQTAPHARLVLLRIGTPRRMTISLRTSHYFPIVANSPQLR